MPFAVGDHGPQLTLAFAMLLAHTWAACFVPFVRLEMVPLVPVNESSRMSTQP